MNGLNVYLSRSYGRYAASCAGLLSRPITMLKPVTQKIVRKRNTITNLCADAFIDSLFRLINQKYHMAST